MSGAAARLREAAALGDTHQVLRLLEDGAALIPDDHGRHALHLAASAGHADVVAALLLAGADVNVTDALGCTALQRAAADGHIEVVKQLIKHGANINHQDNMHGNTALHEASWKGFSRSVGELSKARANLQLKNCGGFAALHLCCQNGHNQSCRELLLAGCNPDLQNNYGDTPLHTSARYGHAGVTRILISAQCHVSDQNKNGDTALHIAAAMGRRKLTRILLEAGCNKNLKNKQNETAKDIATRKDLNEILTILDTANVMKTKSKVFKPTKEKEPKNEKKREKNESGTSSKDSSSRQKDKKKHKNMHKVHFGKSGGTGTGGTNKQWSPYGCHYYPDPKAFPQPNLDSLPHEPLKKGEQYYLDLAGNIRKGPVGVGYTCYCAPFFRHMEERLDRDKRELKAHIDEARDRLDRKVSSLERRTQGQLTELSRRLARGAVGRHSERVPPQRSPSPPPVPRARSLEDILDEQTRPRDRDLNRSFDALLDKAEQPQPRPRECASSDSSDAEDDEDAVAVAAAVVATPDYENVDPSAWKKSVRQASDAMFLRGARTAVYSPTHESDTHNDSGYSTKMYGSSKGPSPSLSGQLEVDVHAGARQAVGYAPQKRAPVPLQRYNQSCEDVVVSASLV